MPQNGILKKIWRGWDLNPHPRAYESPAPPLSYLAVKTERQNVTTLNIFCQLNYQPFINSCKDFTAFSASQTLTTKLMDTSEDP